MSQMKVLMNLVLSVSWLADGHFLSVPSHGKERKVSRFHLNLPLPEGHHPIGVMGFSV